ncbi:MAG TPA: hypothetical protein VN903_16550 [Polyangia bacterium]|nr:hypothetical protein [Polyangia bacterium]
MADDIRITPGGFITSKPRHMLGEHGASPFLTSPFTIEGFQNLINYYGSIAWPILNSTGDTVQNGIVGRTNFLGNNVQGTLNNFDMPTGVGMSTVVYDTVTDGTNYYTLNNNGEFLWSADNTVQNPTVGAEKFTTAGTITIAAGGAVVGAGTAWLTDVLTGPYGLTPSLNKIYVGDILRVQTGVGNYISFRIASLTTNVNMTIWPAPTAGNPAIGAGLAYTIWRTGYNSKSRVIPFNVSGANYFYYCGNLNHNSATNYPYGTIECNKVVAGTMTHFMAPQTVDSAGTPVADILADDLIYYKGFILYGAGSSVSWSVAGAPTALPFGTTDFPAKNISIVDASSKFVSFEYLGDQVVALFEDSMWLVVATGTVPEFTFYKMPELESVINPGAAVPGIGGGAFTVTAFGRPSTSGRGAVYYTSNRGVEKMPGGLADEVSAPISTSLRALFGALPLYIGWDNAADTVLLRAAWGVENTKSLIYNVAQGEWSTLLLAPPAGQFLLGMTPSVQLKPRNSDHTRLAHLGYYETLTVGGTVVTNGANIRSVSGLIDENTPTAGLVACEWLTPMIPLGLTYGDYSTGGFVFDAYSLNTAGGAPVTVTWTRYGGSSPYNIFQRETNSFTFSGALLSPWVSSRVRYSSKADDPFVMFKLTSSDWIGWVALTMFKSDTPAKR